MNNYKATPEHWRRVGVGGEEDISLYACVLELRARVEILEATQHAHIDRVSAKPAPVAGGLVERVAHVIGMGGYGGDWSPEARAAILEVARWLREHGWADAPIWFEREAGR